MRLVVESQNPYSSFSMSIVSGREVGRVFSISDIETIVLLKHKQGELNISKGISLALFFLLARQRLLHLPKRFHKMFKIDQFSVALPFIMVANYLPFAKGPRLTLPRTLGPFCSKRIIRVAMTREELILTMLTKISVPTTVILVGSGGECFRWALMSDV